LRRSTGFSNALPQTRNGNSKAHYHLHCLIPGGAWNQTAKTWKTAHASYLFGKDALSRAFQARFIRRLHALRRRKKLDYDGDATPLHDNTVWDDFIAGLWKSRWVVYPKATGKNPTQALDYLARYTHRVAISDHRILSLDDGVTTFAWRDRADNNTVKNCTIPATQFIGRFLLHILPHGFAKIRSYGWLASRHKTATLAAIRSTLGANNPVVDNKDESVADLIQRLTGVDVRLCPHCKHGQLLHISRLEPVKVRGPP
jgi:hypothetical protein